MVVLICTQEEWEATSVEVAAVAHLPTLMVQSVLQMLGGMVE